MACRWIAPGSEMRCTILRVAPVNHNSLRVATQCIVLDTHTSRLYIHIWIYICTKVWDVRGLCASAARQKQLWSREPAREIHQSVGCCAEVIYRNSPRTTAKAGHSESERAREKGIRIAKVAPRNSDIVMRTLRLSAEGTSCQEDVGSTNQGSSYIHTSIYTNETE